MAHLLFEGEGRASQSHSVPGSPADGRYGQQRAGSTADAVRTRSPPSSVTTRSSTPSWSLPGSSSTWPVPASRSPR